MVLLDPRLGASETVSVPVMVIVCVLAAAAGGAVHTHNTVTGAIAVKAAACRNLIATPRNRLVEARGDGFIVPPHHHPGHRGL
ncbi:hypothetical protein [Streptomyces sp. NRRL S-244]|uniref:hypothetical protein n=1 Tax=Streptomyces sp. NRRL S-244 TaxID=1463897 RepID=UPI00131A6046|nr:hypothetical protein [Streptomyces sp. NRRL S-244]